MYFNSSVKYFINVYAADAESLYNFHGFLTFKVINGFLKPKQKGDPTHSTRLTLAEGYQYTSTFQVQVLFFFINVFTRH